MASNAGKIIPHLWYDKEAKQAAAFYASVFPQSKVLHVTDLEGTPSGDVDVVSFEVWGQRFAAISAGPLFKFNPSISFMVNFDPLLFGQGASAAQEARKSLDSIWGKLGEGGKVLMPLDKYPFSERYGWIQDRFGLSWQLILTNPQGDPRPPVIPCLMFADANNGKAEAAIESYLSIFRNAKPGVLHRYGPGMPNREGAVMFADFMLENSWFAAMDGGLQHGFGFNEAVSLMVSCDTQAEIDHYWGKLSAVPEAEQCGWLKDRFGVSWQIVPSAMDDMMRNGSREQIGRVTQAFLKMKKFDLAALKRAYA
ncbi:MAG: VOC family protein [Fibrobacteres bacterium]|jgi:predicted 3-demethylubiquinone-9 3-methyltransferase (glyoxalase superfamily)|nr:VOC family protein [Fibrobacterota bacterium]